MAAATTSGWRQRSARVTKSAIAAQLTTTESVAWTASSRLSSRTSATVSAARNGSRNSSPCRSFVVAIVDLPPGRQRLVQKPTELAPLAVAEGDEAAVFGLVQRRQ